MKRKGTTIVEVIVVMAIIVILISCLGTSMIKKLSNDIAVKSVQTDLSNILTLGKQYSYSNEVKSNCILYRGGRSISLIGKDSDRIAQITLPKGFEFTENQTISIDDSGMIRSTSIIFEDRLGDTQKVTIAVGTDIITIY